MEKMHDILVKLEVIAESLEKMESGETAFLESIDRPGEFVINGNMFGLLHLARTALQVAIKSPGSHQHFDEVGMLDKGDKPFIIARKNAEWD